MSVEVVLDSIEPYVQCQLCVVRLVRFTHRQPHPILPNLPLHLNSFYIIHLAFLSTY
jgi:hypothetical protein